MAVTVGLPFMSFAMIRICWVTLDVPNHSRDMLGWADPGAITAAHRSLLYSVSALISDALNDVASYLSFSKGMLVKEPYNHYFPLMFNLGFSLIASQNILLYTSSLMILNTFLLTSLLTSSGSEEETVAKFFLISLVKSVCILHDI